MIIRLEFPIDPRAKQRARVRILDSRGNRLSKLDRLGRPRRTALAWTPQATRLFEQAVRLSAQSQLARMGIPRPMVPSPDPVFLVTTFYLRKPKTGRSADLVTPTLPAASNPDLDNLMKAVWDGLTRVLWTDDSQVIHGQDTKLWAPPGTRPRITMVVADSEGAEHLVRSESESVLRRIFKPPEHGVASLAVSLLLTLTMTGLAAQVVATR